MFKSLSKIEFTSFQPNDVLPVCGSKVRYASSDKNSPAYDADGLLSGKLLWIDIADRMREEDKERENGPDASWKTHWAIRRACDYLGCSTPFVDFHDPWITTPNALIHGSAYSFMAAAINNDVLVYGFSPYIYPTTIEYNLL